MAIENLPLFNAVNDEEVKHPAHPHHGHPSHPFDCAPHGRPFTAQEAHYEVLHRVEACISEVHRFEERVRFEVEKFMRASNTENQAFKEALQAAYNCFLETVQNEVNNFEQSMRNDYDLFRSEFDRRIADFETGINNAFESLTNEIRQNVDVTVSNMTSTHEALMDDLRAMRTSLNENYAGFVNNMNNAFKAQQTTVNNRLTTQDNAIAQFGQHMVDNLPDEVRDAITEKIVNGELTNLMLDWFGTEHRFRGAATYENRYSIEDPVLGDYFYCTDNEHFYMYAQVHAEGFEGATTTWVDVGTGIFTVNQLQAAIESLNYSHALYLENLRVEFDSVNKTVKLVRTSTSQSIIFTSSRWARITEDKTFDYNPEGSAIGKGFSCAFVYNTNTESIHMRVMNDSYVTNIFDSHDIILFGVWFEDGLLVEKIIFNQANNFYVDGHEYKIDGEVYDAVGYAGTLSINIDTANSRIVCGGVGHVFGCYLEGATFSRYISAHETEYIPATTSTTYAVVVDQNNTLQMRRQSYVGHKPFAHGDMIIGYAYITYENGVYVLESFSCSSQLERLIYFNGKAAFKNEVIEAPKLHKIFRRVCCCGDSYTSGHMTDPDGVAHEVNEEFSWVGFMERATGNDWINCGQSGANVLTWQTAERGLAKARAAGKVQAYVVGLMLNDCASGTARYVELGTEADIGTNAQTYYGGLSAIIRELNTISPEAKIFVQTTPRTDAAIEPYNRAVVAIVEKYKNTYPIHCLDLRKYSALYKNDSLAADVINGHYTAIGYEMFADNLAHVMSDYISNNVTAFKNVAFIDYDTVNVTFNNGNVSVDV